MYTCFHTKVKISSSSLTVFSYPPVLLCRCLMFTRFICYVPDYVQIPTYMSCYSKLKRERSSVAIYFSSSSCLLFSINNILICNSLNKTVIFQQPKRWRRSLDFLLFICSVNGFTSLIATTTATSKLCARKNTRTKW